MPSACSTAACAARHDQTVDAVLVRAQSTSWGKAGPWHVGEREKFEADDHIAGRSAKEIEELPLVRFACRIGHVVDKSDGETIAAAQIDGQTGSRGIEQKRHRSRLP